MARSEEYNTKQKSLILDFIKKQKSEFTVKDIYDGVESKMGLTTIYRFVDKLVDKGFIKKNVGYNNKTYYQYLERCFEENHFYLKCNSCRKIIHIDCDCIKDLSNHIYLSHKFTTDKDNIIINGLCFDCLYKEGMENAKN